MENIGFLLKKIRVDKNLTQETIAKNVISRSHLSDLEHGKYFPSYDKLLGLLQNLDISLMEFQTELGNNYSLIDRVYIEKTNQLSTEQKINELANYLEDVFTDDIAKRSIRLKIKRLNMLGLVEFTNKGFVTIDNYQFIFNYLLACKNWHEFEIRTLANSIFLADFDIAKILARQFEEKTKKLNFSGYIEKVILFFNNITELALRKKEYKSALEYAKKAQLKAHNSKKLHYLIISNVLVALADLKLHPEKSECMKEINENIEIFEYLNYSTNANSLKKLVTTVLADH